MARFGESLADVMRSVTQRPDELMLDVGAGGERVIASLRVLLVALLLLMPLLNWLGDGSWEESAAGFTGAGIALLIALAWLHLSRQPRRLRWLPFATGAVDISLVTLVLALLIRVDPPAALNSQVVFACYLLAIMMSAMKNDGRATLFIGGLAILQYLALALIVFQVIPADALASPAYGEVSASAQAQRLVILLVATALTTVVVYRMQRLVALSGTDGLTGLPNRTHLRLRIPDLIEQARGEGRSLTVALIDLDRFKRINDHHGHLAGDRALRHVTDSLRRSLDGQAQILRIGGEEFLVMIPQPMGQAWELLDRVRAQLASRDFTPSPGLEPETITISAGLSSFPNDAVDLPGLMKRADDRLRQAKAQGRNCIVARD